MFSDTAAWRTLSTGQRHIAAAILAHLGLSADAAVALVELQRAQLRAGAMRRSDDIETLTALVRMLVGHPLSDDREVDDIRCAYHHLRRCHWWPGGPEDLPLTALLVAGCAHGDQHVARLENLHLALSEGDEVPADVGALMVLCGNWQGQTQVVMRLCALRTELLLSSIPVQPEDIDTVLALAAVPGEPVSLMQEFIRERQAHRHVPDQHPLVIPLAADVVILQHLAGSARREYLATVAIRAWLAERQPGHDLR